MAKSGKNVGAQALDPPQGVGPPLKYSLAGKGRGAGDATAARHWGDLATPGQGLGVRLSYAAQQLVDHLP